jgi:hypothetical protein
MPSIKMVVQKELTIDVNAYYEQFPRKLQAEIRDAVMGLASGSPRKPAPGQRTSKGLTERDDAVVCHWNGKTPVKPGVTMNVVTAMKKDGKEFLLGDLRARMKKELGGKGASTVNTCASNMFRDRFFEVERLA